MSKPRIATTTKVAIIAALVALALLIANQPTITTPTVCREYKGATVCYRP